MFFIWWTKFGLGVIILPLVIFPLVIIFLDSIFPSTESEVLPEYFYSLWCFISFGMSSIACKIVGKSLNSRITKLVKNKWTGKITKDFHTLYGIKIENWSWFYGVICFISLLVLLEDFMTSL